MRRNRESECGAQIVAVHDDVNKTVDHRTDNARATTDETGSDVPNQKHRAVVVDVEKTRLIEFFSQHHEDGVGEIDSLGKEITVNAVQRKIVRVVDFVADDVVAILDDDGEKPEEEAKIDDDYDGVVKNHDRLDVERLFEKFAENEGTKHNECNVCEASVKRVTKIVHQGKTAGSRIDFFVEEGTPMRSVEDI